MMATRARVLLLLAVLGCATFTAADEHEEDDHHEDFGHSDDVHGAVGLLSGAGTSNPSKFIWQTAEMFNARAKIPLMISYRAVGSSTGQKEIVGNEANNFTAMNDFGAGDLPMTAERFGQLDAAGRKVIQIPFAIGAISVFINIPEIAQLKLDLDGCVLAKIFSRQITMWNHQDIKDLQKDSAVAAALPAANIEVVHRKLGSSSTAGLTEYLGTVTTRSGCPNAWPTNTAGAPNTGSTVEWKDDTSEAQGSSKVAAFIKDTPYAIGYLSAGHGHAEGFNEIELENAAGTFLNSQEALDATDGTNGANGIAEAATRVLQAEPSTVPTSGDGDWSNVNLYDQDGPSTWPIVQFSYLYLQQDQTHMDGETAGMVDAFVTYTLSVEGQRALEDFSFVGVPNDVLEKNAESLSLVEQPTDFHKFTFESSTEPYNGAGEYVISSKRKSYVEVEHTATDSAIAALEEHVAIADHGPQIAELQREVLTLQSDYMTGAGGSSGSSDPSSTAVAALVLACLSTLLSMTAAYLALTSKGGAVSAPCGNSKDLAMTELPAYESKGTFVASV